MNHPYRGPRLAVKTSYRLKPRILYTSARIKLGEMLGITDAKFLKKQLFYFTSADAELRIARNLLRRSREFENLGEIEFNKKYMGIYGEEYDKLTRQANRTISHLNNSRAGYVREHLIKLMRDSQKTLESLKRIERLQSAIKKEGKNEKRKKEP